MIHEGIKGRATKACKRRGAGLGSGQWTRVSKDLTGRKGVGAQETAGERTSSGEPYIKSHSWSFVAKHMPTQLFGAVRPWSLSTRGATSTRYGFHFCTSSHLQATHRENMYISAPIRPAMQVTCGTSMSRRTRRKKDYAAVARSLTHAAANLYTTR